MNSVSRFFGHICDNCPFCNWARKNPDTKIGKAMEWHGKWCPAWKAQKEIEKEREGAQGSTEAKSS